MSYLIILLLAVMVACMPYLYKKLGYLHLVIYIPVILFAIGTIYFRDKSTFSLILAIITLVLCLIGDLYSYHKYTTKKD